MPANTGTSETLADYRTFTFHFLITLVTLVGPIRNMIDYSTKKQFFMEEKDTIIELTADMKTAALRAERDFETGKCFSEADFKEWFVKWL